MSYGLLNFGSFLFGLIAWVFPVINLAKTEKDKNKNWVTFSIASVSACAISLCLQIFYGHHLVVIEDWSALMDTSKAVVLAASVQLVITLVLNIITSLIYSKR